MGLNVLWLLMKEVLDLWISVAFLNSTVESRKKCDVHTILGEDITSKLIESNYQVGEAQTVSRRKRQAETVNTPSTTRQVGMITFFF